MTNMVRIGAALAVVALMSGCSSIRERRGFRAEEALIQSVQPGIDNRTSVERTLGRPSFISQFGEPVWYYVGSGTAQRPFTTPRIEQQTVLAVRFDAAGNVASVGRSGMEKVARISLVGETTPRWVVNVASWKICSAISARLAPAVHRAVQAASKRLFPAGCGLHILIRPVGS